MSSVFIGSIGILTLILLLLLRMPIGLAMGLVGFFGYSYFTSFEGALGILRTVPYATAASYDLSVLPLFLLMGAFAHRSGMSKELYHSAYRWVGGAPGGLAIATIVGCAGFAAVSGSTLATASTMGMIALPEMNKYKYDKSFATGSVAAGGSLGILIPPSSIFIIYGVITEQSIGQLFIAGILPGLLLASLFIVCIYFRAWRNPHIGPKADKFTLAEKIAAVKGCWQILLLFLLIMAGLYLGLFTPTEAAGVGAFGAFVFALIKKQMTWSTFHVALLDTVQTTAMIFIIIIGAMIFGYFLAISRLPFELASFVGSLAISPYFILFLILLAYLLMGCILDTFAMVILTVPIFYPVILKLGFNPIWFGVIMVLVSEMGVITPPVGMNVYVLRGVAPDVPLDVIFKGVYPYLLMMIICAILVILFPSIALFLPEMMK